jgi:hypothetical protein
MTSKSDFGADGSVDIASLSFLGDLLYSTDVEVLHGACRILNNIAGHETLTGLVANTSSNFPFATLSRYGLSAIEI